jgi:hypothetical protein
MLKELKNTSRRAPEEKKYFRFTYLNSSEMFSVVFGGFPWFSWCFCRSPRFVVSVTPESDTWQQGCKMVCFQTKPKPQILGRAMEEVLVTICPFYGLLLYLKRIWYSAW